MHELQLIMRDLGQYGCVLPKNFQVNAILAKLPTSWCDFVTAHRHLKQQLTLNELIAAINVEEKSKTGYGGVKVPAQANLIEHKNHPGKNVKKEKAKLGFSGPKANTMKKKKKPEIVCYVCGGLDHFSLGCRWWIRTDGEQGLGSSAQSRTSELEADFRQDSCPKGVDGGSVLMGNRVLAAVRGVGQMSLKLISGKTLVLKDVLFIPVMTHNLLSGSMLCR
ncbi:uncharacterized protein LOC133898536 [Phragmites australis]|uniref:uncharacterized protein LOC133898536 n=1 Tax=Phragmites australis TaxID=29695 RepID=UPI002D78F674|nr:uncharacterized protein LOC133898536 [Phragmites australis]